VLFALVALACVVLAEPQLVEVYRPISRTRYPFLYYRRLKPGRVLVVNDRLSVVPVPSRVFVGPGVPQIVGTPPLVPVAPPAVPVVTG